jgi:serine/threonine-protein kinase RsbW
MTKSHAFEHAPESVSLARVFANGAISGAPPDVRETVTLLVSELATNCIRHSQGRFELSVAQTPREIRVEATDRGTGEPVLRSPGPTDPTGRGLQIVDMLASSWGFEPLGQQGKRVWFTVDLGGR